MTTRTVYLRFNAGELQRSEDRATWVNTQLAIDPVLMVVEQLANHPMHGILEGQLPLDEQRRIGSELWKALFKDSGNDDYGGRIHLVPVPTAGADNRPLFDLVCRLPWTLMTRGMNGPFLARDPKEPVAITIDGDPERAHPERFANIRFPPYPEMVLVIPDLKGAGDTEAEAHRAALQASLHEYYISSAQRQQLHFIKRFDELEKILGARSPKLIYFHGHGEGAGGITKLQFDLQDGTTEWKGIDEIRVLLDRLVFPPVVWINACNAGADAINNALRALSGAACAVVVARTIAYVEDSRALGEAALPAIAIHGYAPASALRNAIKTQKVPVALARWANPAIAVQYGLWSTLDTEARAVGDPASIGDFQMRMDRAEPLKSASAYLRQRLDDSFALPCPLIWRGSHNESLEVFEQRLSDSLSEMFVEFPVTTWRVDLNPAAPPREKLWPNEFFNEGVLCSLLNIRGPLRDRSASRLKDAFINQFQQGPAIAVFEHGPLNRSAHKLIADYLGYWGQLARYLGLGAGRQIFVVLGFAIGDDSPVDVPAPPGPLDLRLGPVGPRELAAHLWTFHDPYGVIDEEMADTEAAELVTGFSGAFRPIHESLEERLRVRYWTTPKTTANPGGSR